MRHNFFAYLLAFACVGGCTPQILDLDNVRPHTQVLPGHIATTDGLSLPYRSWPTDSEPLAIIVALHGFNDYSKFFEKPGSYFAAHGITSYAFDQRGFGAGPFRGRWFETDRYVEDAQAFVEAIAARHKGTPLYVLGNSMGGAVVLTLAAQKVPEITGAILTAPATWGRETMPLYQTTALWLAAHTVPRMQLTGRGLKIRPSDNIEMLRALGRDPLVIKGTRVDAIYGLVDLMDRALDAADEISIPTLILYGKRDEIIRSGPTRAMLSRFQSNQRADPTLALYDSGYHMLLRGLNAQIIWNDIRHWMTNRKTPLPSGSQSHDLNLFGKKETKQSRH